MRFFHLSDLHIGLKLMNRDLYEDQEYILKQITDLARRKKPDGVVIAGDIYDKAVPSAEAVDMFSRFVTDLTQAVPRAAVMVISGNHDSGPRVDCFRDVLSRQNLHMIGMPPRTEEDFIEKVILEDEYGSVNFYLLPFVKPSMVRSVVGVDSHGNNFSYDETLHRLIGREAIDESERNVLVSHQFYLPPGKGAEEVERTDSEIRTVGNIDQVCADVLEPFDYAALGHIHKPMNAGREVHRYCGAPLACSVSEAGQEKGVVMVDLKAKGETARITLLPLRPFRQVRVIRGRLEEVLARSCGDYVTVILTDRADLDVMDMQDRIRMAFPFLLEIRREGVRKTDYTGDVKEEALLDPYGLCCAFLKDLDQGEKDILRDVIHTVQGVK